MTTEAEILVVGAGPTGLALAMQAHACGARVRVVDRRRDAWRPSRALLLHARTLEVLRPFAITDALLAEADVQPRIAVHTGSRTVIVEPDASAIIDSPFAHLTVARQADLEAVLAAALADRGVKVERGTTVTRIDTSKADRVRVRLSSAAGSAETECLYLAGCDGAPGTIRREVESDSRAGRTPTRSSSPMSRWKAPSPQTPFTSR